MVADDSKPLRQEHRSPVICLLRLKNILMLNIPNSFTAREVTRATPSSTIPHTSLARTHPHLVVITFLILSRAIDKHAISPKCRQTHRYNCSILLQLRVRAYLHTHGGLVRTTAAEALGVIPTSVAVPNSNVCCGCRVLTPSAPARPGVGIDRARSSPFGSVRIGPGVDTRSTTLVHR